MKKKMLLRFSLAILFAVLLANWLAPRWRHTQATEPERLFNFIQPGQALFGSQDRGVKRTQALTLNAALLAKAQTALQENAAQPFPLFLNLFPDASWEVLLESSTPVPNGFVLRGKLLQEPQTFVHLAYVQGVLAGSVISPEKAYAIRFAGADSYSAQEIDPAQLPPDSEPLPVPAQSLARQPRAPAAPAVDDGSVIDVLIAYTPAARALAGGTAGMVSLLNLTVAETNTAFTNSRVQQQFNLVHTVELNYTETGNSSTDLQRFQRANDGYMDGIQDLRDQYRADLVTLITTASDVCGVAYVMTGNSPSFAPFAYGIVVRNCLSPVLTYGHETGHNQGLNHARADYTTTPTGGAYSFSFGYKDPANLFRTVMAYDCPGGCIRVPHFSSPAVNYQGRPTGIAASEANSADAAQSLNNTRATTANFRVSVVSTVSVANKADFDRDGKTDLSVWRGNNGQWLTLNSSTNSLQTLAWGAGYAPYYDLIVPGDYDGDGKTDQAIWRGQDSIWYIRKSSDGQAILQYFGANYAPYFDLPVPGDYDGDGKTDIAVWRPTTGTWFIRRSTDGTNLIENWGQNGDTIVPGDYDGDRKTDLAYWRGSTGTWVIKLSSGGTQTLQWGAGYAPYFDVPVQADYDGDGKTDIGIWRGADTIWYLRKSRDGQPILQYWGANYAPYNDIPTPGDYDGDGKADIAVWRPTNGTWYVQRSSNGSSLVQALGTTGDTPVPTQGVSR